MALSIPMPAARRQNWVLDPFRDALLVIGAPALALGLALATIAALGAERGIAVVLTAHVVLTVAHHLPTFIRIYGDVDLFRRYRWHFLLAPVIPLAFAVTMLAVINGRGMPVETILYLYVFLALWDPWHFLRQHFGFTRLYDRNNAAPRRLASNMDWWLCAIWFLHIMVASAEWIPSLLDDLYRNAQLPLLLAVAPGFLAGLASVTALLALLMTVAYAAYLAWCLRQGYYVSAAKLALLATTFGVMYLTYTPNALMQAIEPAWSFKVGFATVGIVHMTQYLAIVWRYDRRLAESGRARGGWFAWLHARRTPVGLLAAGAGYTLLCIVYGDLVTTQYANRWLMSVVLAIGFTSTLLHYYYDGFIWKLRHQQNREALDLGAAAGADAGGGAGASAGVGTGADAKGAAVQSWWTGAQVSAAAPVFARQLLYFGLPLGVLTVGALTAWSADRAPSVQLMYEAQRLSQAGRPAEAADATRRASRRMQAELPYVGRMAALQPSAARVAEQAFLTYNDALYAHRVLPQLDGREPSPADAAALAQAAGEAARLLRESVAMPGDVAHAGREQLTREQAERIAASWERSAAR